MPALDAFREVGALSIGLGWRHTAAISLSNQARTLFLMGNLGEARDALSSAQRTLIAVNRTNTLEMLESRLTEWELDLAEGNPAAARTAAREASTLAQRIGVSSSHSDESSNPRLRAMESWLSKLPPA